MPWAPARPSAALALLDGWAVAADASLGAGSYAPALLPEMPQRVEVGQPLPPGHRQRSAVRRGEDFRRPGRSVEHYQPRRRRPGRGGRLRCGDSIAAGRRASSRHRYCRLRRRRHRPHHRARAARARAAVARQRHHQRCRAAGGDRHRAPWRLGALGRRRTRSRWGAWCGKRGCHRDDRRQPATAATTTACRS